MKLEGNAKPIANPSIVLREEFDDWAILFNPDTAGAYGLDPIGVSIWKLLDGSRTKEEILAKLKETYTDMSQEAGKEISDFIDSLEERGLAGYEVKEGVAE